MSERAALVAAVASNPDDDLPRLVFADWLDENGEPERAEFVRLQIAARREAEQFPPVIDKAKLARIRELFLANYRDWLRPVYEAFRQPLPVFDRPPEESAGFFDRGLKRIGRVFGLDRLAKRLTLHQWDPNQDQFTVTADGVTAGGNTFDTSRPIGRSTLGRGHVDALTLSADRVPRDCDWGSVMTAEPITQLTLRLPADVDVWRRIDGPHLRRVRSLNPHFTTDLGVNFGPVAQSICGSEHFTCLRSLFVGPHPALFDALRGSALRARLARLSLDRVADQWQMLDNWHHGFDALAELAISINDDVEAGRLTHIGINWSFRRQLTSLTLIALSFVRLGVGWMWVGPEWERLESLHLHGSEHGDSWATALAGSGSFIALRVLRITHARVTDAGASTLAKSPLVGRLRALILDGNLISDDGATELAAALDRGLGYLSLASRDATLVGQTPIVRISARTERRLSHQYGSRIAFAYPTVE